MARRRWLLGILALGSLVLLAYASVLFAYSVPISERMENESRLPGDDEPRTGQRALVVPVLNLAGLPTAYNHTATGDDRPGTLLLVSDDDANFPAGVSNASVVRALAYVTADASGTIQVTGIPARDGDNATTTNLTLDVANLAQGRTGFLVKADATPDVRFVPENDVVGQVAHFEPTGDLVMLLVVGAAGFVLPIVALLATHRPSGKPGIGDVICNECRGPTNANLDFCTRCGAYKKGRGGNA